MVQAPEARGKSGVGAMDGGASLWFPRKRAMIDNGGRGAPLVGAATEDRARKALRDDAMALGDGAVLHEGARMSSIGGAVLQEAARGTPWDGAVLQEGARKSPGGSAMVE